MSEIGELVMMGSFVVMLLMLVGILGSTVWMMTEDVRDNLRASWREARKTKPKLELKVSYHCEVFHTFTYHAVYVGEWTAYGGWRVAVAPVISATDRRIASESLYPDRS